MKQAASEVGERSGRWGASARDPQRQAARRRGISPVEMHSAWLEHVELAGARCCEKPK